MPIALREPRLPRKPTRQGRPVCFTIDYDAETLLRAMRPNSKGLGVFLSELIRKEARERAARPQLLETLAKVPVDADTGGEAR
jgi:hypothetical protein